MLTQKESFDIQLSCETMRQVKHISKHWKQVAFKYGSYLSQTISKTELFLSRWQVFWQQKAKYIDEKNRN